MSSLLVKLRNVPHTHNGQEHPAGSIIRIPDDVALTKIKRGEADLADSKELVKERDAKKARAAKKKAGKK
jgi:hypothetical protein